MIDASTAAAAGLLGVVVGGGGGGEANGGWTCCCSGGVFRDHVLVEVCDLRCAEVTGSVAHSSSSQ